MVQLSAVYCDHQAWVGVAGEECLWDVGRNHLLVDVLCPPQSLLGT